MASTNRFTGKSAALAAAYGMGAGQLAGMTSSDFWRGYMNNLSEEQQAWADAFGKVLGVGPQFYSNAPKSRKDWLQAHYLDIAKHNTKKGRRAAKVVAKFTEYRLCRT